MQDSCSPNIWFSHRVSYGETDTMGYLYYAEYLHIFERGRNAFIRHLGISYAEVEKKGLRLPVCKAMCHYRQPAYYDNLLKIHIHIHKIKKASLSFKYTVMDEAAHALLAEGSTLHACTNIKGQLIKIPQWFMDILHTPITSLLTLS